MFMHETPKFGYQLPTTHRSWSSTECCIRPFSFPNTGLTVKHYFFFFGSSRTVVRLAALDGACPNGVDLRGNFALRRAALAAPRVKQNSPASLLAKLKSTPFGGEPSLKRLMQQTFVHWQRACFHIE